MKSRMLITLLCASFVPTQMTHAMENRPATPVATTKNATTGQTVPAQTEAAKQDQAAKDAGQNAAENCAKGAGYALAAAVTVSALVCAADIFLALGMTGACPVVTSATIPVAIKTAATGCA